MSSSQKPRIRGTRYVRAAAIGATCAAIAYLILTAVRGY